MPLARFLAALVLAAMAGSLCEAASYHVQRLASGFHLPVYATTAPGDDDRIFVVQLGGLASHETDGDPNTSAMGKIMVYKRSTGGVNVDPFLVIPETDLTDPVTNEPEVGLWALAFHPDYQNNGRFFVNVAVENDDPDSPFSQMIREYAVSGSADLANPTPTQLLIEIPKPSRPGNTAFNHNGSWMGFNPLANAANDGEQYLYITLGDGGDQHDPENFGQRRDDLFGGTLRIDVDAPPDEGLNYHIPTSNPFYDETSVRKEIWNYGLRNPWQASFDRETGDFWITDVGQGRREEVNFQPASSTGGENYGWRLREGSAATPSGGVGGPSPPGAIDPVYDYLHFGFGTPGFEGNSIAGGRLYRGPVESLQGKYVFADSRSGEVWNFDPDDPYGTVTRMKLDPQFTPDAGVIDYVVSISEDNHGNLLIVDYDGELYQVFPNFAVTVTIDRDTGQMTFANETGVMTNIRGYALTSSAGALNAAQLTPITGRLDASATGDGTVDPLDAWEITSSPGSQTDFSEQSTGAGAALGIGQTFQLGNTKAWFPSIYEDVNLTVTLGDNTTVDATVLYVGNGGRPFSRSDLNFNGELDPDDWVVFRQHHGMNMTGLSLAELYGLGDLDGDGDNDFFDFRLFQSDYIAANGAAAFAALGAIPEPSTAVLVAMALGALSMRRRRGRGRSPNFVGDSLPRARRVAKSLMPLVALAGIGGTATSARADLVHQYTFNDGTANDSVGTAHGAFNGDVSTSLGRLELPGATGDYVNLPGSTIDITEFTDATFEAWLTFGGGGEWQRVFDFGRTQSGQGRDYIFYSPSSGFGDNRAAIRNSNFPEDVASGGPPLSVHTEYHVAVVVDDDANGGSGRMSLYLDGTLRDDVELSYSLSQLSETFAYLGRSTWSADPYFNGSIDEFRIYDHALTSSEVEDSFAAGTVPLDLLRLDVDTVTGQVAIVNGHTSPLAFDYYRVTSAAGALNVSGWSSLDTQDVDSIGTGQGQSWDELGEPTANLVTEAFLLGATNLDPGESRFLGELLDPATFGSRQEADLVFEFGLRGGGLTKAAVNYLIPPSLPGDYNDNGVVDAADYVVWRRHLDDSVTLPNEVQGVTPGTVSIDDYEAWRTRFGNTLASVVGTVGSDISAATLPEPAGWIALALGILIPTLQRGRLMQMVIVTKAPAARVSLLVALVAASLAVQSNASTADDAFPVNIRVDAGERLGELRSVWRFFGADEPNYAYMKDGRKLLAELGELRPSEVFFRAHNLLNSGDGTAALKWGSTGVYSEDDDGNPVYDWTIVDRIFSTYLERGVRPYVQIGFMPRALSRKPEPYQHQWTPRARYEEIFTGWAHPPTDYEKWQELVYQWAKHCREKFGDEEVRHWYWQVWNEANAGYWQGTPEEFHRLHDHATAAVRRAIPDAKVGGPDVAGHGGRFTVDFLRHCLHGQNYATGEKGTPLDFVSFHAKGSPEMVDGHVRMGIREQLGTIDEGFRIVASFPELQDTPVVIGESDPEGCAACQGPQLAYRNSTMYSSYTAASFARKHQLARRHDTNLEGVLTWAFEFEDQPYFAGFRALATNGIDLPVLNVFRMFARMNGEQLAVESDGEVSLRRILARGVRGRPDVTAIASATDQKVCVLAWHYHDDDLPGSAADVSLVLQNMPSSSQPVAVRRFQVDAEHSNAFTAWQKMGSPQPPSADQYTQLERQSRLAEIDAPQITVTDDGLRAQLSLPRQAVTLIEFSWTADDDRID